MGAGAAALWRAGDCLHVGNRELEVLRDPHDSIGRPGGSIYPKSSLCGAGGINALRDIDGLRMKADIDLDFIPVEFILLVADVTDGVAPGHVGTFPETGTYRGMPKICDSRQVNLSWCQPGSR